jgi:uncharacterized protein (DUF1499 family)
VLSLLVCLVGLGACGAVEPGSVAPADIPDPLTLERSGRPNDWLICPPDACRAEADAGAPSFAIPPERLLAAWREVLADQSRATLIAADEQRRLLMAQDRTPLLRFVDTITVRVLPTADGGSTFAAYSRSEIGYGDLGTNRKRLQAWVAALEQ